MNYPDWAPIPLVKKHIYLTKECPPLGYQDYDPEMFMLSEKYRQFVVLPHEEVKRFPGMGYKSSLGLTNQESAEILGKLITDIRMKDVWPSIAKRAKEDREFSKFWSICQNAILGWRYSNKLSSKHHKEIFQDIHEQALKLSQMMLKTREFEFYSINTLISTDAVKWLLRVIRLWDSDEFEGTKFEDIKVGSGEADVTKYYLNGVIPSIYKVLNAIALTALEISKEKPSVRKPNSEHAAIHYCVRFLSAYLKETYCQPLHDVVAATVGVLFDQENIDSDYVKKILR